MARQDYGTVTWGKENGAGDDQTTAIIFPATNRKTVSFLVFSLFMVVLGALLVRSAAPPSPTPQAEVNLAVSKTLELDHNASGLAQNASAVAYLLGELKKTNGESN